MEALHATGSWYYEVVAPGWKYNLSDVLAAIGLGQLERFEEFQAIRAGLVARYQGEPGGRARGGLHARPRGPHARVAPVPIAIDLDALTIDRARFIDELRARTSGRPCTSSRSTGIRTSATA